MLTQLLIMSHVVGFLLLLIDLPLELIWLRRQGTSREKRWSTRLIWTFNRIAPFGYVLLFVSGGILVFRGWSVLSAWIVGGIVGYAAISFAPTRLVRPATADTERGRKYIELAGRLGALLFIAYCMEWKLSWPGVLSGLVVSLLATVLLAFAATRARPRRWMTSAVAVLVLLAVGVGGWRWQASKLPESFSVSPSMAAGMDMGAMKSVADLRQAPSTAPVVNVTLTAEVKRVSIAGRQVDAWSYNGTVPGPTLRAKVGDRLHVTLVNRLPEPTTIHWHGVPVPNADDGVAGVTQDAVRPGAQGVYDFVLTRPGTFWYHSHQDPFKQLEKGLYGSLIVDPATAAAEQEQVLAVHTWDGATTVNSQTSAPPITVTPGLPVRLRVINTDSTTAFLTTSGAPFTVLAFDSGPVNRPQAMATARLQLGGSGRIDLGVTLTAGQEFDLRVGIDDPVTIRLVTTGSRPTAFADDAPLLDPLRYGERNGTTSLPEPANSWTLSIQDTPGFFDGRLGTLYSIDGALFPHGKMLMVQPGKTYQITFKDLSGITHPMHLHGHVFQVTKVNGESSTGSPVVLDTVDVLPFQTITIRFTADNPGLWMAHCHNLPHAANGMDLMVAYENVMTPYRAGHATGNKPE